MPSQAFVEESINTTREVERTVVKSQVWHGQKFLGKEPKDTTDIVTRSLSSQNGLREYYYLPVIPGDGKRTDRGYTFQSQLCTNITWSRECVETKVVI